MPETIVIDEASNTIIEPTKLERFKKILTPKNIVITIASAAAIIGGAVVFALARSDESDFEAEQAKFDAEDAAKITSH